ncbi:DUF4097 family beta strand repeat-containing protein [Streptomyces sp. NPDC058623]|uniref:DUF4097 family beta strand repeat-containing protein n=1 Tax=Streptomyces sp. NPDC058623 TaxID=3346563 RepID=UPI00365CFE32
MASDTASALLARKTVGATAAAVLLLLAGCSLDDIGVKTSTKSVAADATVTEAVTAVEVADGRSGSVEVTAGAGPGVVVHRTVHYRGDTAPVPGQRVTDGALTFTTGCSETCWVDYRLEVPAAAKVKVGNSSGRITVTGVAAAELTSESGDVRADRIAGPLKVRTSSGSITAADLAGPEADVRSESGDARLGFRVVPVSVNAVTISGDVTLRVPRAPYQLSGASTSGERDITLPHTPTAPSRVHLESTSGDIGASALT